MADTPAHAFIQPKLDALVEEARAHGIARDTAIAVMLDILGGEIGEPDGAGDVPAAPGAPS